MSPAIAACGDDSDDGSGGSGASSSGGSGSGASSSGGNGSGGSSGGLCAAGMVNVEGMLDGTSVSSGGTHEGRALLQTSDPATLSISWNGGSASFQWTGGPVANGDTVSVTGIVSVDGSDYCFGSGSQLTLEDAGFDRFTLESLTEATSNDPADCPGTTSVSGSLEGCADAN